MPKTLKTVKATAAQASPPDFLLNPKIIFIGPDGKPLDNDQGAVAFELPEFGRQCTIKTWLSDSQREAEKIAADCDALGAKDWYLPKARELFLLVDHGRLNPATFPALAPHTPTNDWYWTSSIDPSVSSYAGCVGFRGGFVSWLAHGSSGLVRACRRVSPRQ